MFEGTKGAIGSPDLKQSRGTTTPWLVALGSARGHAHQGLNAIYQVSSLSETVGHPKQYAVDYSAGKVIDVINAWRNCHHSASRPRRTYLSVLQNEY